MKNMKKQCIKIGFLVGAISMILMCVIALLWFGYDGLIYDSDNKFVLQYFVPIWAIGFGFCGYGLAKQYYTQKTAVLGDNFQNSNQEKLDEWINYKRLIFSNAFKVIAKIAALGLPVYIIAFLDNSRILVSNISFIIILFIISLACFILSKHLENKYRKNIH